MKRANAAIRTRRLVLRLARPDDLDDLFEVYGDVEVMAYWDSLADENPDQTARRLSGFTRQAPPHPYRIIESEGRAVGTVGVHSGTEIGFILKKTHWRQGVMTEALTHYIPWAFATLGLPYLTADTDPRNVASLSLLKKFGFQETGRAERVFQVGGVWVDSVYLRLQRPS